MNLSYGIAAVVLVAVATVVVGALGLRRARTAGDFYVASRTVSPIWNASAIGGEYLSAASFLGVAGLVLAYGVDMLWYPVGYTAGYLVLLALVAAPLRRSGAYTLPDFAESRLESIPARRVASGLVVLIGWLYLVPQLQAAGLTLSTVTGAAPWVGGLVVCVIVMVAVLAGGMRSITFAQAFQFWLKLTALLVPVVFVALAWHDAGSPAPADQRYPTVSSTTRVTVASTTTVEVPRTEVLGVSGRLDGRPVDGPRRLSPGEHRLGGGTTVTLPAGAVVPTRTGGGTGSNLSWALPLHAQPDHPLYAAYSLILATFLGTMGLPHVLVRFYTNPDGRDTRRTTLAVTGLLATFYLLPTVYGALARLYAPDLLLTGQTDSAVLVLPTRMLGGTGGELLSALVTAGAFAAFLSTSSGLTVSVAGVLSQDVLRAWAPPVATFRVATVLALVVPFALALSAQHIGVAVLVGLAFAVAASSFCPLLVLGIWWRRLTDAGAIAGLAAGGGLAAAAVLATVIAGPQGGWPGALLAQPAAWSVPVAFAVMVAVSVATSHRAPAGVARAMVRLHLPESLKVDRGDWDPERRLTVPEHRVLAGWRRSPRRAGRSSTR